ncbi:MAG: hypothetical protein COU46_02825 [Candidatus Niyogibacteria bacterium CG10_big_fil_rev_8_21_14_0_10_42_19]|uniref:Bacterial type II secretion system protein E domain-containing protein n=1 Tax=Candidatus Niyogibacteria bacterium CG10_big_fil_rev_8_21_14_0_10_42_19 TaxID=1974725 RepID=A0A2H0TF79_9BACT|nr:MAG: hypothetical protein COU46_02825 [Candidatus Niyogibacteria bacterium CG10_big_fil_rev_8_21_14_0_10_42_19]
MVSDNSLQRAWSRYAEVPEFVELKKGFIEVSPERIKEFVQRVTNVEQFRDLIIPTINSKKQRQTSEILEVILAGALQLEASDVHIEPREEEALMRLRLDGVLQDIITFTVRAYKLLLSRTKLISELKLNVHEEPQDGRFTIKLENTNIEIRTSILPGPYGESIVLRILNPKTIALTLEDLGMSQQFLKIIDQELKAPNGMILTTGPTGSGKTTTLYAFIRRKKTPGEKIITIEDPIEYHIPGITQTQVNTKEGYTFADGLRSILRQDPDILLVGEIRDLETANTAMHAALTGHLVFSTLHTNDAAGTIPRLIDLGVKPSIIAPAINIAMAQRLIRRLCKNCRGQSKATDEEMEVIKNIIKNFPDIPGKEKIDEKNILLWRPKKCQECNNTGYKGRVGAFEILLIDDKVEHLIMQNPSQNDLVQEMKRQNMPSLIQDGFLKVIEGETTLEELERVIGTR